MTVGPFVEYRKHWNKLSGLTRSQNNTRLVPNESFYTIVGEGSVSGNQSLLDVGLGSIVADDFATGLFKALAHNFDLPKTDLSQALSTRL